MTSFPLSLDKPKFPIQKLCLRLHPPDGTV